MIVSHYALNSAYLDLYEDKTQAECTVLASRQRLKKKIGSDVPSLGCSLLSPYH
jgi:hypothetical protein